MSDKIDLSSNETRVEVDDTAQTDSFKGLYKIPIEKYTKKKQGDYLPWSMAWGLFSQYRPDAEYTWEPDRHFESGEVEVVCTVTSLGRSIQMILPVLQNNNKPAINPNRHQINTARMRCLTKAIAMHGLGLSCWNWVAIQDIEEFGDGPAEEQEDKEQPSKPAAKAKAAKKTKAKTPKQTESKEVPAAPDDTAMTAEEFEYVRDLLLNGERTWDQVHHWIKDNGIEPTEDQLAELIKAKETFLQSQEQGGADD